jgi:SAM-dependent methyltransferase
MRRNPVPPWLIAPGLALALGLCATSSYARLQSTASRTFITYRDASPVIQALRQNLPSELRAKDASELEVAWPGWVLQRDQATRARLERGDEDSIVYFWQYGTSFTKLAPLTERNLTRLGGPDAAARILEQRLDDLLAGIASPQMNERLHFARRVLERRGIDPTTPGGAAQARAYLDMVRRRVLAEYDEQQKTLESAQRLEPASALAAFGTMFRDRGLSSDTSLLPSFAIDQALETGKNEGLIRPGSMRRVAIVGPGLDFANKDEGYDFYPQQTIQPFGLMDSLVRLGLAPQAGLVVTTFDLSPRVNQHLDAVVKRARTGGDNIVHVPLQGDEQWNAAVLNYWRRFGSGIGKEVEAGASPPSAGAVRMRAVRIPSARVASIVPRDLNIVLERLEPLPADQRFDLIVATNILVYYDVFEQELALANIASMLRPGGLFLSNTPVPPLPPMKLSDRYTTISYSDRHTDHLFWYERE